VAQKQTQLRVISKRCKLILRVPQEPSIAQLYRRVARVNELSSALIWAEDYDTAKIPLIEILWPAKLSPAAIVFECSICRAQKYEGGKYICQTCADCVTLCEMCYKDFKEAKRQLPDSLKDVMELEKHVLPVRHMLLDYASSIHVVSGAMMHFVAGSRWVETALEKYEVWEQKHNSYNRFRALPRPGQELLKLVAEFSKERLERGDEAQLQKRFENYQRRYGFIHDTKEFKCLNHQFMVITDEEAQSAKAAGINLDSSGRMRASFLQGLIEKYNDDGGLSDPHTEQAEESVISQEPEEPHQISTTTSTTQVPPDITTTNRVNATNKLMDLYGKLAVADSEAVGNRVEMLPAASLALAMALPVTLYRHVFRHSTRRARICQRS
jgi:hypothetical protein